MYHVIRSHSWIPSQLRHKAGTDTPIRLGKLPSEWNSPRNR